MKVVIQVSQAAFQRREHTHKTRLACLRGKINGVAEAEIVNVDCSSGAAHLIRSPL